MDREFARIRKAREFREASRQGVAQTAAGNVVVSGQFMLSGIGESTVTVTFPVKFRDKPFVQFGWELANGQELRPGYYPEVASGVAGFSMVEEPPFRRYFDGMVVSNKSRGQYGQRVIVTWRAEGTGFTNPVS